MPSADAEIKIESESREGRIEAKSGCRLDLGCGGEPWQNSIDVEEARGHVYYLTGGS